jgi:Family of unknown function (DUF6069)
MSTTPIIATESAPVYRSGRVRRRARLATVATGVGVALAFWALGTYGFGLDVRSPAFGDGSTGDVGAAQVLIAAIVGSLLGWASLSLLERFTVRAAKLWSASASLALLVSLGAPFRGSGVGWESRAVLATMHILVAVVLIAGLFRTSPRERQ